MTTETKNTNDDSDIDDDGASDRLDALDVAEVALGRLVTPSSRNCRTVAALHHAAIAYVRALCQVNGLDVDPRVFEFCDLTVDQEDDKANDVLTALLLSRSA